MALDFPAAPAANQEYTYNTRTWVWNGTAWQIKTIATVTGAGGTSNTIQFNANGLLSGTTALTWTNTSLNVIGQVSASTIYAGTITSISSIYGFELWSTQSVGDEGGQVNLALAQTNQSLTGNAVVIDVYRNKLRIFEQGGTNRGVYIDLSTAAAGVNSNLLNSSTASVSTGKAIAMAMIFG